MDSMLSDGDGLVSKMCPALVTPWTVAYEAPLSTGFSRQECQSGVPCPPPGNLRNPGIKPASPVSPSLAGRLFTIGSPGKPFTRVHIRPNVSDHTLWICLVYCVPTRPPTKLLNLRKLSQPGREGLTLLPGRPGLFHEQHPSDG